MSASSSPTRLGWKSSTRGRGGCLSAARSHAFRNSRCLIDLTTEGSALSNCIGLAEFQDVAGGNTAGRTVNEIAVDDGAKLRHRQLVAAAHQILDLEAAILADGLE